MHPKALIWQIHLRYAVDLPSDTESEPCQPADPEGIEPQQISPELQRLRKFTRLKTRPDYYAQQNHLTESPSPYKEATTTQKQENGTSNGGID